MVGAGKLSNWSHGRNAFRKSLHDAPAHPPLTLAPRKPRYDDRPIIAYDGSHVLVERTGEVHSADRLPVLLVCEPSSIVVCENAPTLLAALNDTAAAHVSGWQYRVTPVTRRVYRQHRRDKPTEVRDFTVGFFGWRFANGNNHYHYPLDPIVFANSPVGRLVDYSPSRLHALLTWGTDVRGWCREHGLQVSSASGSLATQLLKDPRFYPEKRRKVPRATNERARPHLPGNHYELFTEPRKYHDAYYLDMRSAHHFAASSLSFPSSNGLLARGAFREPPESIIGRDCWARPSSRIFRTLLDSHGLLLVRLQSPHIPSGVFAPPYMKKPGTALAYVYTNELSTIRQLGGIIEGIEAAWTSFQPDTGLNKFARWAIAETATMTDERKRWAKPALLAAYGMLAARPSAHEFGYRHAVRGEETVYRTNAGPIPVTVIRQNHESESPVVNVIQRGMIEAEIRLNTLGLARTLHSYGVKILCVYADSVIVDSTTPLPLLPEPWSVKTPLNRLQFFNPTSFHSDQMVRLPGIPEGAERLSYAKMMGAVTGDVRAHGRKLPPLRRTPVPREIRRMVRAIRRDTRYTP